MMFQLQKWMSQDAHEWAVGKYGSGRGLFASTVPVFTSKDRGRNNGKCPSGHFITWPEFEQNTSRTNLTLLM